MFIVFYTYSFLSELSLFLLILLEIFMFLCLLLCFVESFLLCVPCSLDLIWGGSLSFPSLFCVQAILISQIVWCPLSSAFVNF